ncbi:MAG TPA: DUF3180 family protein [Jatrophihabitantaceae bacterium]|jgi:hypothetical protein
MRRTTLGDLLVPFLILGGTAYVLLRLSYDDIPPLSIYVPVPLALLAIAELVAARRVRAAVRHDPNARPMAAIVIARCVALGKASALVAAGVAGAAAALLARVIPDAGTVRAASNDLRVGIFLLVASLLLAVAGILLERAGIDPNQGRPPTAGG